MVRKSFFGIFFIIGLITVPSVLYAQSVSVKTAVSAQDVYIGETVVLQIQIDGSDTPERPDMTKLGDFSATFEGGRANNSHSVSIINGNRSETIKKGYLYNYRLTPLRTGALQIPPITVRVDGTDYRTSPISIRVQRPAETDDYKLRMLIPKDQFYIGEPIPVTFAWYWNPERPVTRLSSYTVPILKSDDFEVVDYEYEVPTGSTIIQLPVQGENTILEQSQRILDGIRYTTLEFERIIIPRESGTFTIPASTVVFEAVTGREQYRDFFGRIAERDFTAKFVVPSNAPEVRVFELPTAGRPANFSGLVGRYQIDVSASHTSVNVGDPITITITVSGTGYLGGFSLPKLTNISRIAEDFHIPDERGTGVFDGTGKVFTQTIRAKRADVVAIPSLELTFFNPETKSYSRSVSDPIPIEVKETRIVTILDVEGAEPVEARAGLETSVEGIAYNYEDLGVIEDSPFGLEVFMRYPLRTVALALAPIAYFVLLIIMHTGKNRASNAAEKEARRAFRELRQTLGRSGIEVSEILEAIRVYFGKRFKRAAAALTTADIERLMRERGLDSGLIAEVIAIYRESEAGHYGGFGSDDTDTLPRRAIEVMGRVEEALG